MGEGKAATTTMMMTVGTTSSKIRDPPQRGPAKEEQGGLLMETVRTSTKRARKTDMTGTEWNEWIGTATIVMGITTHS